MKALVRIAPRRHELHVARRVVLRWGIPLAIISALAGMTYRASHRFAVSPPVRPRIQVHPSRVDGTFTKLSRAMYDSFPSWLAQHPGRWCPDSVRELLSASLRPGAQRSVTNLDSWNHPMEIRCGVALSGHTIQLRSPGPDGIFDTRDDLYISR